MFTYISLLNSGVAHLIMVGAETAIKILPTCALHDKKTYTLFYAAKKLTSADSNGETEETHKLGIQQ